MVMIEDVSYPSLISLSIPLKYKYIPYLFIEVSKRPFGSQIMSPSFLEKILLKIKEEFEIRRVIFFSPKFINSFPDLEEVVYKYAKEYPILYITNEIKNEELKSFLDVKSLDLAITVGSIETIKAILDKKELIQKKRVSLVLTPKLINQFAFYDEVPEGIYEIIFPPPTKWDYYDREKVMDMYERIKRKCDYKGIPINSMDPSFFVLLEKSEEEEKTLYGCSAFVTSISVDVFGNLIPCYELLNYKLGSILTQSIKEIIKNNESWIERFFGRKRCLPCPFRYTCGGCSAYRIKKGEEICRKKT